MKTCSRCKEEKSIDSFWKRAASVDGLNASCQDCQRIAKGINKRKVLAPDAISKECTKCKKESPLSNFKKDKRAKSGLRSNCRDCESKMHKKWVSENKDYIKIKVKERYKQNPEKYSLWHKEFYKKNKERISNKRKEDRKNNPEKYREWEKNRNPEKNKDRAKRAYYNNWEKRRESNKNWRKNNPEKFKENALSKAKRDCDLLKDVYVKSVLRVLGVKKELIEKHPEILELKKLQIINKRLKQKLNKIKNNGK
jgi:hypothetical protein